MIDEKKLINSRPENLNDRMEDEIKSAHHKGWNECNSVWIDIIEEQPKIGQWIPCSERLPDIEYISGKDPVQGHYLTCNHDGNMNVYSWCEGWNCFRHPDGSVHNDYEITDIVAWMPLPEAYKESEE